MKNREFLSRYLIVLILFLVGVTFVYTFINRSRFMSKADTPNIGIDDKVSKSDRDAQAVVSDPSASVYSSSNEVENPGLKIVSTYEAFNELASRENIKAFFVFGRKGCHYCDLYQPILKEVAELYKIEVAYIDMAALASDDYDKVLHAPLKIPAKCSKTGEETDLSYGFGTPLSLFVDNYTTYDCIRGYKEKMNLITSLRDIGYIN